MPQKQIKLIETFLLNTAVGLLSLIAAHSGELSPSYSSLITTLAILFVNMLNGISAKQNNTSGMSETPTEKIIAQAFKK